MLTRLSPSVLQRHLIKVAEFRVSGGVHGHCTTFSVATIFTVAGFRVSDRVRGHCTATPSVLRLNP
jgi:hypothetical protein